MSAVASDNEPAANAATFRSVLSIREFRALYFTQTFSVAGDQLARIAVAVIIFTRTGSTFLTGLSYAVSYLPWLIGGPLLSRFADNYPRREVLISCDVARAALLCVLAVPELPTSVLIALVAILALGEPPAASAQMSLIPDIVGEGERFPIASTLVNVSTQIAIVAGFALGGGFVAVIGAHLTLVVDALTFIAAAIASAKYLRFRPAPAAGPDRWLADLRAGFHEVYSVAKLRWLVIVTWLIVGANVATEALAVPYAHVHGQGSTTAGLLIASLPLGTVVGAIVLGRFCSLESSERLMLPLALAAPAVLSLTAFNPPPALAGAVWFATGAASAMTVTANRVFVTTVPHELRGRAFGIVVAGVAVVQGMYALLAGLLAGYVGPADALADLALPTFALVVIFSIVANPFRDRIDRPTRDRPIADDEEHSMPASVRRPDGRVWALIVMLVALAATSVPLLSGKDPYLASDLPAWWLFVVFVVAQIYPLNFEIRHKSFLVVLETVPLVLGLVFLAPLELVELRVVAVVAVLALVDRDPPIKWIFNGASTALATLAAVEVFGWLSNPADGLHPAAWPAIFAAVATGEVLAALLLLSVLWLSTGHVEFGRTVRVVSVGTTVGMVMTFLGLFTAAALAYDVSTAWAISIFFFIVLTAAQTYHRLAERADALDRLYVVARELGPIASDPSDLAPALIQLRQVVRAHVLELTAPSSVDPEFATVVTVSETGHQDDQLRIEQRPLDADMRDLLRDTPQEPRWRSLLRPTSGRLRRVDRISVQVHAGDREIGVLSALNEPGQSISFNRSDLRLLETAADQLAGALEKGRLVESLRRAAELDTLTGLANLDSLRKFLDTSLEGASGGVLILLNLDRFREVNDMLGHDAGDAVLAEVARRLQSAPIHGALAARVGGDQFALAIPGAAGSEVAQLAAMAVKSRVDGSLRLDSVSADIRVTVGIARSPDHGNDGATLLRRAEMAMAAAKGGTSGIGEWEPDYERDGSRRLQLLTGLRAALSDGSLRVEYQPKLVLGSGEVTGFEALVRWTHPDLGPVSPVEFVPLAEATGLISALTSTVLRQALTTCRSWHDAGKPVGIAVNVSARSLDDSVLVGQVAAMLTASGLEPRWLTLEITESSVMEDHSRSLDVLRDLRRLGVRLSIDDFGTGYSSLHQLRGLPVHEVKIDRSFVNTVDSDEADRAVVHAVVELCDSLGLITVAEGVEKASQAFALETLGVRQVQGYLHSRPMTEDSAMEWLMMRRVVALAAY